MYKRKYTTLINYITSTNKITYSYLYKNNYNNIRIRIDVNIQYEYINE